MTSAPKKNRGKCNSNFWTKAKITELIKLYESRRDLWDVSSKLYSNRYHKLALQSEIAEKLQTNPSEVGAKLHNIRCQYNAVMRKIKSTKSASDAAYVPRWEYFDSLKFLTNGAQELHSFSNVEQLSEPSSESSNSSVVQSEQNVSCGGSYRKKKPNSIVENAMKILAKSKDSSQIFGDFVADQIRQLSKEDQKVAKRAIQQILFKFDDNELEDSE